MKWRLKVLVQFVLAHVPGGERINHRLQLAGGRHTPAKIRGRITAAVDFLKSIEPPLDVAGKAVVEVGTGWDGLHPILLSLLGARHVTTFDHVRHLRWEHVKVVLEQLDAHPATDDLVALSASARDRLTDLLSSVDLDDMLRRARISYVAPGDAVTSGLPSHSVDLVYSYAVFEHLPERVVNALLVETRRILAPGGVMICVIGTGDHYTSVDPSLSRVNFLKYPEWIWAPLVKNRISYHNRLRERQFIELIESSGGRVRWRNSVVYDSDVEAARRMKVDRRFTGMTPEELAVSRSELTVGFDAGAPSPGRA